MVLIEGDDGVEDMFNKKVSWLFIFNNVDDFLLFEDYWLDNLDGFILLISRNLEVQVGRLMLDLELFEREEVVDLF